MIEVTLLYVREAETNEGANTLAHFLTEIERSTQFLDAGTYLDSDSLSTRLTTNTGGNIQSDATVLSKRTIEEGVLRYVQTKDRYLALASVLLKSRAFYEIYPRNHNNERCSAATTTCATTTTGDLPVIIELPRTKQNKPFIPCSGVPNCARARARDVAKNEEHADLHPLSISHQYPLAGMARWLTGTPSDDTTVAAALTPQLLVGFDIVVFDPINTKLYNTVQEFVDVFRDCFAPREWAAMTALVTNNNDDNTDNNDYHLLRELYLRWAVKEAYTKALGVGMGFPFASFETQTMDHLGDETVGSLWNWISQNIVANHHHHHTNESSMLQATATVRQRWSLKSKTWEGSATTTTTRRPDEEQWVLHFLPLFEDHTCSRVPQNMIACGVVCVGPILSENPESAAFDTSLKVDWTSIADLIAWHVKT